MIAPFPYFGGKHRVAAEIWLRFGDTPNYVEPFCGSCAVLLARPDDHMWQKSIETVNDVDGLLANFWRAMQRDPDAVAHYADWPINEADLFARHLWLVNRRDALTERLMSDPDWHNAQAAGWWVWGICSWIGSGWCTGDGAWASEDGVLVKGDAGRGVSRQRPHLSDAGEGVNRQMPHLGNAGRGVNRKMPHLGNAGRGVNRKRPHLSRGNGVNRQMPHLSDADVGLCAAWSDHLRDMMRRLADRLRRVRVCCGDWTRVLSPSVTTGHGITAVFLDPPYSHAERADGLYAQDHDVAAAVREWALAHGDDSRLRIALCGYEDEHMMHPSWEVVRWKTAGGYGRIGSGRGLANARRETVWFSPHCLRPGRDLFAYSGIDITRTRASAPRSG